VTRVDLIVPTYNGSDWLRGCLNTLTQSTFNDFRLVVFDDASTEDIRAVVAESFPSGEIIRVDTNVGLARGFNLAIETGAAEYVVLLNNDTEVDPDWLGELVAAADRHPEAGSIASRMRLLDDRVRLHSAGDYYSVRGMPGNRGVWQEDAGQYDREEEVFSACGGAALYRRAALDAVRLPGGQVFDERLFMYCEDVELGWRLQTSGFCCVYAPRAIVYHALSATGGGTLASYYVARNIWLVRAWSVPRGTLDPWRARAFAYHSGRVLRTLRRLREPAARATLRGTAVGLVRLMLDRRSQPRLPHDEVARLRERLWHSPVRSLRGE
jgi:GT2 family glycosyltransferase